MKANDIISFFQRATHPMKQRILLMIGRGIIKSTDDAKPIQEIQTSVLAGETMEKVPHLGHFGFASRAPKNSECIVVALGGNRENLAIIATENRTVRFKNLAEGESAIYTDDGTYIHLKKNGQVEIKTATKVKVDAPDAEFTGNVKILGTLEVTGAVTMQSTLAVTGASTLTGPVTAPGGVSSTGTILGGVVADPTGSVAALRSAYNAHTHPAGTPNTGPTNNPV